MSTQLILYPQNYRGRHNSTSTSSINEYVVNGINYAPFPATGYGTNDNYPSQDAIINQPPNILGNWYSYYTIAGGPWGVTGTPPSFIQYPSFGNAISTVGPLSGLRSHQGFYQQLSGLTVGASYDIVIDTLALGVQYGDVMSVELYSGNVLQFNQSFGITNNGSPVTFTTSFIAQSTNPTFLIDNNVLWTFMVGNISIQESPETATNIYTDLNDGQVICDLYAEEDIPLTLSIDEFKNVAEQVKSYSKDFNLPATKRNNQIFNNMFEVTRAAHNTLEFNPYIRTQCVLKQDGFILFEGYLRLIDVKDQEGEISYNVNLYSDVVALADILKDQTFAELDFTELEHDYNKTQIKYSWNDSGTGITYLNPSTSGFRDAFSTLKYPFIDWTHQYLIGGTGSGSAATAGNPELTSLEQAFRPCIQLKYLINKIFAASGFNWTSTFFDSVDFGKLYMDFNWGADNAPVVFNSSGDLTKAADFNIPATYTTLAFDEMNFPVVGGNPLNANFGYSAGVFTAQEEGQVYSFTFNMEFNQGLSVDTLSVQWLVNGVPYNPATSTSTSFWYSGNFTTPPLAAGDTILCQAKSPLGLYDLDGVLNPFGGITPALVTITTSSDQTTTENLLETLRGEIGQWDFLKGIMTMFNLVSMVDENDPDNILIEPYADVFVNNTNSGTTGNLTLAARSIQHDWTDKVDVSQIELNPLTNLNKSTVFKFVEDDDDYAFNVFKQAQSGHLYGSVKWNADGFTILDGEEEIIAEPFAATVSKPLDGQFSQFITPAIYSMTDDGTSEGFENSPRIFYNNGIKSTGASYYIPPQNGLGSENQTNFLQFSHLSDIPTVGGSRDFVFRSTQLPTAVGTAPTDNLFSLYWQPYFNELYNADTRTMTLKVNLSPTDIASFKFYDTVFIKNRTFRVNRIEYKPNSLATVEFILIP